jgi:hypothetical protein
VKRQSLCEIKLLQIKTWLFILTIGVIILAAFPAGFGYSYLGKQPNITSTHTTVTYVQISGTNHSLFYVTEVVIVEPAVINDICVLWNTNTTVSTSFILPTEGINGSNPIGLLTTQTIYQNESTTTVYENVTEVSNGVTCTLINPHYDVSQSNNCPPCV